MTENKKLILAVVGMAGSGKSEVIKYLQKTRKWPNIYFGSPTFERMKKDGLALNYANERITREKIRQEMGMGAYAILSLPNIENELKKSDNVLIESLYSWDEYKIVKEKYPDIFKVMAVFASPETRFKRLNKRLGEKPLDKSYEKQKETSDERPPIKDLDEFITRDYSELEKVDKGGPIARADFTIINESDVTTLHKDIDSIIKKLIK